MFIRIVYDCKGNHEFVSIETKTNTSDYVTTGYVCIQCGHVIKNELADIIANISEKQAEYITKSIK
jgi:transcription initiation factor TFIIIB Brf1 subunit/transcription initiation factor TFIIB